MKTFTRSQELLARAARVVPGGMPGHQNPDLLVRGQSPCFVERAEGCRFWDADGYEYIDYMCAYGPMIIGYNNPDVEKAVADQKRKGDCFNLPSPLWVDLAERFVSTIAAADWVTFGKNGSDACNHAVRVARAFTGRNKIIMAQGSYHGIGQWCTPNPRGITPQDRADVLTFPYNDVEALRAALKANRDDTAAVVVTPFNHQFAGEQEMPSQAFLQELNNVCRMEGPLLIMDDVRAGFRLHMGGSAEYFGLKPHLSCFSKALGNGYPISACAGQKELMAAAAEVYFTGSFFSGAEAVAAALVTLDRMEGTGALEHIFRMGEKLKQGMLEQAAALGLEISYTGPVTMPFMFFKNEKNFRKNRIFCAQAYQEGVFFHPLHNWFVSAAHQDKDIDETLAATQKAFEAVKKEA